MPEQGVAWRPACADAEPVGQVRGGLGPAASAPPHWRSFGGGEGAGQARQQLLLAGVAAVQGAHAHLGPLGHRANRASRVGDEHLAGGLQDQLVVAGCLGPPGRSAARSWVPCHHLNSFPHYTAELAGEALTFIHVRGTGPNPTPLLLLHGWPDSICRYLKLWGMREGAYTMVQGTKPQTLAFALNDSPAGFAAGIIEKFHGWSDCDGRNTRRRTTRRSATLRRRPLGTMVLHAFAGARSAS